jgi:hypothetical protein
MERDPEQLVLETSPNGDEVFLHANPAALRRLATVLERLAAQAEAGDAPHDHFFTEAWGGHDLAETLQTAEHRLVHHLKIYGWPALPAGSAHGT